MAAEGPKPAASRRPGCLLWCLLGAGLLVALIAGVAAAGSGGRAGHHRPAAAAIWASGLPPSSVGASGSEVPTTPPPTTLPTTTVTSPPTTTSSAPPVRQVGAGSPGSCEYRGSGVYVLPDPACTPGATDSAVTQSDLGSTICQAGWTETVRPPESFTEPLKYEQMAAYGDSGSAGAFEEDHLVPLELGGSPTSPLNLWPEPGATPNPKDAVENAANHAVCDGQMTLAQAQQAIASDWITLGRQLGVTSPSSSPPTPGSATTPGSPPTGPSAPSCTASASYDTEYDDYDVYVRSDQPDETVTVSASGGASGQWHTDGDGYADVYLKTGGPAPGQQVTVAVGSATCSTTLP